MRPSVQHGLIVVLVSLAGAALALANRIPRFSDALHTDETTTLLMAETQKSGGVMYRDLWTDHAPGIFLLTAMLPEAVLRHEAMFRLLSVVALVACVVFLADLSVRAELGFTATFMGMLVFTLLNCNMQLLNQRVEAEQFTALWLVLALWFIEARGNGPAAWLVFGVALMFKQSNVAWLPFLMAYDGWRLMRGQKPDLYALLKRGTVVLPGLGVLGFFAAKGAAGDLLQSTWTDALHHSAAGSGCQSWYFPLAILIMRNGLAQLFTLLCGLACCGAAAVLLDGGRLLQERAARLLGVSAAILAGGMLYLFIQQCGRIYYIEPLYPAFFLIVAWAFHWSIGLATRPGASLRRTAGGGMMLLLLAGIAVLASTFPMVVNHSPTERLAMDRFLARQMKARFPQHTIYAVTSQPGWYWYTRQTPPKYLWVSEMLQQFPGKREAIYQDAVNYGRGKKLLVLFLKSDLWPDSPEIIKYRDRMVLAGATRFVPEERRTDFLLSLFHEVYEWDLTGCGAPQGSCPVASSSAKMPPEK